MNYYLKQLSLPSHVNHLKIDIGLSYSAPQSQIWLSHEPNLFVIGFEPNPECIESISNNCIVKKNEGHGTPLTEENKKRFYLIPVALGNVKNNSPTFVDFYQMTNDCGTSSIYKPIDNSLGPIKNKIKVPIYSLSDFFVNFPWGTNNIHYIDYIKIDAQGSDLEILKSAGHYLRERVIYITAEAEYNQYANCSQNNIHDIQLYMESIGFERVNHPNTQDPTFLNRIYKHIKNDIFIYQNG
jgi:FkbM family methyltransferase